MSVYISVLFSVLDVNYLWHLGICDVLGILKSNDVILGGFGFLFGYFIPPINFFFRLSNSGRVFVFLYSSRLLFLFPFNIELKLGQWWKSFHSHNCYRGL